MRRALCDADVFLEDKRLYLCSHRLHAGCIARMCRLNMSLYPCAVAPLARRANLQNSSCRGQGKAARKTRGVIDFVSGAKSYLIRHAFELFNLSCAGM